MRTGFTVTAALLMAASAAHAQVSRGTPARAPATVPEEERVSIPPNQRYTQLPIRVRFATTDPQGRLWITKAPPLGNDDVAAVKKRLVEEFDKPQPEIYAARPFLFEPGGRIWFFCDNAGPGEGPSRTTTVLGYDGKTFIERPLAPGRVAPPHVPDIHGNSALFVNDTLSFVAEPFVYSWGKAGWDRQQLLTDPRDNAQPGIVLVPEADAKGILALTHNGDLWRCRDGAWKPVYYPRPESSSDWAVYGVAGAATGVWALVPNGLTFTPWDAKAPTPTVDILAQLESTDPGAQAAASKTLIERGDSVSQAVSAALSKHFHDDLKSRLQNVLEQIRKNQPRVAVTRVGDYDVSQPIFLKTLADGRTFLGASVILDTKGNPATSQPQPNPGAVRLGPDHAPGVLTLAADGSWKILGGEDLLAAMLSPMAHGRTSFGATTIALYPITNSTLAWAMPGHTGVSPTLLDLANGHVLTTLTSPTRIPPISASDQHLMILAMPRGELIAFRPDSPDPATALSPTFIATLQPNAAEIFCQSGDGAVWYPGVDGIGFFDGHTGATVPGTSRLGEVTDMVPGRDAIIVQVGKKWHLLTRTQLVSADMLENLIEDNRDLVAKSFGGPRYSYRIQNFYVQCDAAGNIWLGRRNPSSVAVLSGNHWTDSTQALPPADMRDNSGIVLWPAGDGSHMYVGRVREQYEENSMSFLATFHEGAFAFAPAPDVRFPTGTTSGYGRFFPQATVARPVAFSDRAGALWFSTNEPNFGDRSARLSEKGVETPFTGNILGFDADDHPWVHQFPKPRERIGLARVFPIVNQQPGDVAAVPFADDTSPVLTCADHHVLLPTDLGLADLAQQAGQQQYIVRHLYSVARPGQPVFVSNPTSTIYVPDDTVPGYPTLRFFKLPS